VNFDNFKYVIFSTYKQTKLESILTFLNNNIIGNITFPFNDFYIFVCNYFTSFYKIFIVLVNVICFSFK
jgi:hypothetical protein